MAGPGQMAIRCKLRQRHGTLEARIAKTKRPRRPRWGGALTEAHNNLGNTLRDQGRRWPLLEPAGALLSPIAIEAKEIARRLVIVNGHMQVSAGDADVGVAGGVADFRQGAAAG